MDKQDPPVLHAPPSGHRRLHSFTAWPSDLVTILAPRRCPPVNAPNGSTATVVPVFTSTGFRNLTVAQYASAVRALQPDIAVPLASLPQKTRSSQSAKHIRMVERTEEWLTELQGLMQPPMDGEVAVFAPVLPVDSGWQCGYWRVLASDHIDRISGLAVYDVNLLPDIAHHAPPLAALPKLSLQPPASPHEVLRQISLGVDLCAIPFLNHMSDSGIALTFRFPPPVRAQTQPQPQPLGLDVWTGEHSVSARPLVDGCTCYACSHHHRAYLHHLLHAKEMLGWTLLQMHNHQLMSDFFHGVRQALAQGQAVFDAFRESFTAAYDPELPGGTGQRPRARGYHFKSERGQTKINKPSWGGLENSRPN